MKNLKVLFCAVTTCVIALSANAQQLGRTLEPLILEITTTKTTSIVFPNSIVSVDRGSKSVLAQKANGVENILQVKAANDTFVETNLTVVTADGKLSSFLVRYAESPNVLTLSLTDATFTEKIALAADQINKAEVKENCLQAIMSKGKVYGVEESANDFKFQLSGLFIKQDLIYCRMVLQNTSNIKYDIEQLRFYIRDQKKAKRTSSQEVEVMPVFVENEHSFIDAQNRQVMVFVLPKFTIPDNKYLAIEILEKNGGRNYALKVTGLKVLQAKQL